MLCATARLLLVMDNEIKEAIEKLAGEIGPIQVTPGIVKSVDRDNWVIDVEPLDGGADILEVRLRSFIGELQAGWIFVPAVSSTVLVGFIDNKKAVAYVASYGEIDEVVLLMSDEVAITIKNDGTVNFDIGKITIDAADVNINGDVVVNKGVNLGAVKVTPMTASFNTIITKLNLMLIDIQALWAATPALVSVTPTAPSTATPVPPVTATQYSNDKLKH